MARIDAFAEMLDREAHSISKLPAIAIREDPESKAQTGAEVAKRHPFMCHYTGIDWLNWIKKNGIRADAWVSPTTYSACLAPYRLGLYDAKDIAVILETAQIPLLWGPGTAPPGIFNKVWTGGGIEYQLGPSGAPESSILHVLPLEPCGDADTAKMVKRGGALDGLYLCKCGDRH
ncbi:hypothetical protein ACGFYM_27585 [Streptomyces sp. NPDC048231]|uniref:hypothetical protein n=1 Tax=Streptomyces sp. NPDC048231 TaxID=3365519 RepID=UPI00371919B2